MHPTLPATASSELPIGPRLVAARYDAVWIRGDAAALEPPLVAIVGTREADSYGASLARAFATSLARRGVGVLSGGALGIDAHAHAGALEVDDGRTAVVLPCGVDQVYPLRHAPLYDRILQAGGALVSPFPPGTPPARWTFPRRNALLAALCDLLIVVQAPAASGSLITAEAARALGRRVLVVPASPDDPRGAGCIKLLRLGAEMCASADDAFAALEHRDGPLAAWAASRDPLRERPTVTPRAHARTGTARSRAPAREARSTVDAAALAGLDAESTLVYHTLASGRLHADEVALHAGISAARIRTVLLGLVLAGLVHDGGDGTFARSG